MAEQQISLQRAKEVRDTCKKSKCNINCPPDVVKDCREHFKYPPADYFDLELKQIFKETQNES